MSLSEGSDVMYRPTAAPITAFPAESMAKVACPCPMKSFFVFGAVVRTRDAQVRFSPTCVPPFCLRFNLQVQNLCSLKLIGVAFGNRRT